MRSRWLVLGVVVAGCEYRNPVDHGFDLDPPDNLTYQIEPSGVPGEPAGIVLRWDDLGDPAVRSWNVYGRSDENEGWALRASTSSNSFHDNGEPELQYRVTAVDAAGDESPPSNVVTVDERLTLERPASLTSVSLNAAIALLWSDNSYTNDPDGFSIYRVYSTSYDIDEDRCGSAWHLEGTTVAPEFRAGALANGASRCFAVSAISVEGFESLWSPHRFDTPRPDARNVVLTTRQSADATAGFRFWRDLNGDGEAGPTELGLIGFGSAPNVDFSLERDSNGRLHLSPVRAGTTLVGYGLVDDLTDIDVAPLGGFGPGALEASPGRGYVFQTDGGDGFHRYGALRVSHVGRDLIIFDWAFQTDPGNPELVVGR